MYKTNSVPDSFTYQGFRFEKKYYDRWNRKYEFAVFKNDKLVDVLQGRTQYDIMNHVDECRSNPNRWLGGAIYAL